MAVYTKPNGLTYCTYYNNGKKIWEPFGRGPDAILQAQRRDLEIRLKKRQEGAGPWHRDGITTYTQALQEYIGVRATGLAANTVDGILYAAKTYAMPIIGAKPLIQITMADWHAIERRMVDRGIKNRTINTYFVYLSGVLSWAADELDLIPVNPWRKRKRLPLKEKFRIDLFTLDEFRRIQAAAEPHLAWAMEVAYHTGVRPGPTELFRLRWDNIDWDRNRIRIHYRKTDTWRWQYLDPAFLDRLRVRHKAAMRTWPDCPYIVSFRGRQVASLKRAWRTAKKKAGIDRRIRMYDIRHYHITHALAAGAPITELAERVGHQTPRMIVDVYAHLAKDLRQDRAFKLPDLYEKK